MFSQAECFMDNWSESSIQSSKNLQLKRNILCEFELNFHLVFFFSEVEPSAIN